MSSISIFIFWKNNILGIKKETHTILCVLALDKDNIDFYYEYALF